MFMPLFRAAARVLDGAPRAPSRAATSRAASTRPTRPSRPRPAAANSRSSTPAVPSVPSPAILTPQSRSASPTPAPPDDTPRTVERPAVLVEFDPSAIRYQVPTSWPTAFAERLPLADVTARLERLSIVAARLTPSPFVHIVPLLAPWLVITPVLIMMRSGVDGPWSAIIVLATVLFFASMILGPMHSHQLLNKRHEQIKAMLHQYTADDAIHGARMLAWRFQAPPALPASWSEYDLDLTEEMSLEIVLLAPSDIIDDNYNVVSLETLLPHVIDDLDAIVALDPPPTYTACDPEKPPEYAAAVRALDAEYELHLDVPPAAMAEGERSRGGTARSDTEFLAHVVVTVDPEPANDDADGQDLGVSSEGEAAEESAAAEVAAGAK
ncbi:hypothetical protein GGF31_003334 [Allomyces arbusculus]|nr:hypothetical protein GGF31_003334 [Allomyces arbusculus]